VPLPVGSCTSSMLRLELCAVMLVSHAAACFMRRCLGASAGDAGCTGLSCESRRTGKSGVWCVCVCLESGHSCCESSVLPLAV
jgi:hypothetical protein